MLKLPLYISTRRFTRLLSLNPEKGQKFRYKNRFTTVLVKLFKCGLIASWLETKNSGRQYVH
ncbi:hypothetical protein RchiOBHm_Chr7g0214331 [Rosa chinensis]|uniref:Uncharacterized protein n=1 Tax=Rosa chinensis TaxID=74649 RepID=A0A2P6PB84_ROSCH|nr:hypothetical protein RchiOBHm_Chr7g0214331 [Rosa chinensis]